jgi:hypothetical protein
MKLGNIDKVITGPVIQRNRMNQTAHAVNYLMRRKKAQPEPRVRGGGGVSTVWGTIVRGLTYPDPEGEGELEAGYDQYIVRLTANVYEAWTAGTYTTGTIKTKAGRAYQVTAEPSTSQEPPHADWQLLDEIQPRPLGQESIETDLISTPPDMRLFVPWFRAGDIIPLVTQSVTVGETTETLYFIDLQMMRVRENASATTQSIYWDDQEHRLKAVYNA